jgi:hypothetical protein
MDHTVPAAIATICLLNMAVAAEPADVKLVQRELPPAELGKRIASYDSVAFGRERPQLAVMIHEKPWALSTSRTLSVRWHEIGDKARRWQEEKLGTLGDVYACYGSNVGAAYSAEGRLLALSPNGSPEPRQLAFVDVFSGNPVQTIVLGIEAKAVSYCFSADRKLAAVCSTRLTRVSSAESPTQKIESGQVDLWNMDTGEPQLHHRVDMGGCYGVAFSPDGKLIAVNSGAYHTFRPSGAIQLFEVQSGKQKLELDCGAAPADCIAFSPDGSTLVSGVDHCMLKSWDVATGAEKSLTYLGKQFRPWFVSCLAYSPDGKILAVAMGNRNRGQKGGEVRLLDATSMKTIATPLEAAELPMTCVAFSADGKLLAACGGDTLKLWDVVRD